MTYEDGFVMRIGVLERQLAEARAQLENRGLALEAAEEECAELRAQIADLTKQRDYWKTQLAGFKWMRDEALVQIAARQAERDNAWTQLAQARKERDDAEAQIEEYKTERSYVHGWNAGFEEAQKRARRTRRVESSPLNFEDEEKGTN